MQVQQTLFSSIYQYTFGRIYLHPMETKLETFQSLFSSAFYLAKSHVDKSKCGSNIDLWFQTRFNWAESFLCHLYLLHMYYFVRHLFGSHTFYGIHTLIVISYELLWRIGFCMEITQPGLPGSGVHK